MIATTRQTLKTLDIQRQALEHEAAAITSELTSPTGDDNDGPPMGIDSPLVDNDGYPRADIDIYRARTLRRRLAEIRTDHAKLMKKQIEPLLMQMANQANSTSTSSNNTASQQPDEQQELEQRQKAKPKPKYDPETGKWVVQNWDGSVAGGKPNDARTFDSIGGAGATTTTTTATAQQGLSAMTIGEAVVSSQSTETQSPSPSTTSAAPPTIVRTPPFARIDSVAPRSPAAHAGLQEGDIIRQFGHITASSSPASMDPFHEVAQLVPRAAGQQSAIVLVIQRLLNNNTDGGDDGTTTTMLSPEDPPQQTIRLTPKPWEGRGLLGCHIVPYHQQ